jgi:hypothetical protein
MIGALIGLALGFGLLRLLLRLDLISLPGQSDILVGALFGAGGALLGGISGEKIHDRTKGE